MSLDLAWAAGVFEGEGSVRISKPQPRNIGALCVDMVNTDREIVVFFADRWPGYFREVEAKGQRRNFWRWRAGAIVAAAVLEDLMPYLRTERVRRRAALGLEFQAQKVAGRGNRTPEYRARQWHYYRQMAELNQRGLAAEGRLL